MKALGRVAALNALLASHPASAGWLDSMFGPQDYEDCVLAGLKGAPADARGLVINTCHAKFPASRAADGNGYVYTVPGGYGNCRVNGPVPTQKELADIEVWKKKPLPTMRDVFGPPAYTDDQILADLRKPPPGFEAVELRWAGYIDGNSEARCR